MSDGSESDTRADAGPDPLFDAHADSDDERWVAENLVKGGVAGDTAHRLSCPSCFALLCLQCQPHEEYEGQFRAVFVQNCGVKAGQTLRVRVRGEARVSDRDVYRPVACALCETEVAVLDADNVYHFCNVMY